MKIETFESDYIYNLDLKPETIEEVGLLLRLKKQYCKEGISLNFDFKGLPYMWIQFKRQKTMFRKSEI